MKRFSGIAISALLVILCLPSFAAGSRDRTQFSRDVHVSAGEKVGDVTCINCSIYIQGQAAGDVTAIHGNIVLETGSEIAGDVTAVWGNVRAESGTQISGDLTAVAGSVRRDPQSTTSGDVTSLEGTKWLMAIILPPIIFVGLIIALVIWLLQRNRGNVPAPTYIPAGSQPSTRA